jgi:hypothetical protein
MWYGKPPQPQVKKKKLALHGIQLATPTHLQNPKSHAELCCNQLPNATAIATEPKIGLEKDAIKVGYSKPRQLLTKQKATPKASS